MQSIRSILPKAIQEAGIAEQVTSVRVLEVAKEAIRRLWGEEKASFVEPQSFVGGVLKVRAVSGPAVQELKMAETAFKNEVNRTLGRKVVNELRVVS
jgi:hypothetical protein